MPNLIVTVNNLRIKNNGKRQVYILVYIVGKRYRFQTGVEVSPDEWDTERSIVKKTNKEAASLNLRIRNKVAKINDLLVKYTLADIPLTAERLREDFEKPEYVFDFIDFMQRAINERKGVITDSTIRQHNGILSKLKVYKSRILSNQMTEEFFEGYSRYLKVTLKNEMNTRHGNFKTIRSYIQIAIRKGLLKESPMAKNPVKQLGGKRIFLSDVELRQMIELYRAGTLSESRQNVLRWFLFSCFTGLRLSDLKRITFDDIAGDLLILIPYKSRNNSAKTVKIPLNDMAKQMIKDEGEYHINNIIFNCISDQKMRKYIKLIVVQLNINKVISWHSSRHTFATVFLRNTNNLAALQKVLGHANIRESMIYAHTMTEDVQDAMKAMNGY
ncbi:MAG: site-specific integrase [Bacteroidales bacterium]